MVFFGTEYTKVNHLYNGIEPLFSVDDNFNMKWDKKSLLMHKLYSPNTTYVLTKSTRKSEREDLINSVKLKYNSLSNPKVISDGVKNRDYSHRAVKGANDLADKDTIIIGSLSSEKEQALIRESYHEYFNHLKQYFEDDLTESQEMKKINDIIHRKLLSTTISQSLGRNQGYRAKGSKTVIVLPILYSNSYSTIKWNLNLNYISENVVISA